VSDAGEQAGGWGVGTANDRAADRMFRSLRSLTKGGHQ
jgi:hypothetical protein